MLKTAFILFLLLASGCKDQYTPKPYGYFRIDFPEKQWVASPDTLPYCFEQSAQAILEADPDKQAEPGWMNLSYPQYNAKLHLSYKEINNGNFRTHLLYRRKYRFFHSIFHHRFHPSFSARSFIFQPAPR